MLKLTKRADYGLIAMKFLAEQGPGSSLSAKDIAEAHGVPAELLAKILQRLVKAGLLVSHHGINGGYALARDSKTITAFDVIRAIEGPVFITSCVTVNGNCEHTDRCTVREPLRKVREGIEQVLSQITISDMRDSETKPEAKEELVTLK